MPKSTNPSRKEIEGECYEDFIDYNHLKDERVICIYYILGIIEMIAQKRWEGAGPSRLKVTFELHLPLMDLTGVLVRIEEKFESGLISINKVLVEATLDQLLINCRDLRDRIDPLTFVLLASRGLLRFDVSIIQVIDTKPV